MSSENLDEQSDARSDSSSQDAAQASTSGDDTSLSRSAISVEGRLVVKAGGAIMVLSSLLSWLKDGSDGFPHVSGVGATTFGTGLAVFVLGLSLLLRDWPIGVTLGKALGSFSITVVFLSIVGPSSGQLDAGAWFGLVGTAVAVVGAVLVAVESFDQSKLELASPFPAGLGAVLAIVASFWLDWVSWPVWNFYLGAGSVTDGLGGIGPFNGLDPDVSFGIPVLIFAAVALVLIADTFWEFLPGGKRLFSLVIQTAGIAVTVIAGANVLGMVIIGWSVFGSAPLVALAGGILMTSAVREANS